MDSLNWMEDCISSLTDGDFSLFVVTCWALWNNQNNHMHSNLIRSPAEIVEFSRQYVQNFVDAIFHQVLDNVLPLPTVISRKWSSPPMSWIKMNFDGACFKEEGAVGLGVVARNRNGCFLEGHSLMIGANLDVEASEAMGALDALRLVRQLGYSRVIIEGDSGNIISAIEFGGYDLSSIGNIIIEAHSIAIGLPGVMFSWVRREGNCVAYLLARRSRVIRSSTVWFNVASSFTEDAIARDVVPA